MKAALKYWQTRTHCCGHIVAHDVSWAVQTGKHLLRTQNVSEQNQKHFVSRTQNLCPRARANGETFVSATMCPQQLSSFASTFILLNALQPINNTWSEFRVSCFQKEFKINEIFLVCDHEPGLMSAGTRWSTISTQPRQGIDLGSGLTLRIEFLVRS